mmetsp:Transcript_27571/g.71388  ORF Transcript_27571/g.71388 Transcript_27571/m.71388 type:complete len:279 (+) Transcript_27571:471-1307(+)
MILAELVQRLRVAPDERRLLVPAKGLVVVLRNRARALSVEVAQRDLGLDNIQKRRLAQQLDRRDRVLRAPDPVRFQHRGVVGRFSIIILGLEGFQSCRRAQTTVPRDLFLLRRAAPRARRKSQHQRPRPFAQLGDPGVEGVGPRHGDLAAVDGDEDVSRAEALGPDAGDDLFHDDVRAALRQRQHELNSEPRPEEGRFEEHVAVPPRGDGQPRRRRRRLALGTGQHRLRAFERFEGFLLYQGECSHSGRVFKKFSKKLAFCCWGFTALVRPLCAAFSA